VVLVAVALGGCGSSTSSGPAVTAALRRALTKTQAASSYTALVRLGGQSDVTAPLVAVGIYQAPDRFELVQRQPGAGAPATRLRVQFAISGKLYTLGKSGITPPKPRLSGTPARIDVEPTVRAMVQVPAALFPRSWTRRGGQFTGVSTAAGRTTRWSVVVSRGLISSITASTRSGAKTVTYTTTVIGVGVSAVPSPSRAAVDEAAALLASE
jgi:hypothetical protein